MNNTDFIKKTADKLGFNRDFYVEKKIPATTQNVTIIPFYGDIRSTFLLSAFWFNEYRKKKPDEYIIVCSWPGWGILFPQADEYWSLKDKGQVRMLADGAENMSNYSNYSLLLTRNLLQHFENIIEYSDIQSYYKDGCTSRYLNEFKGIHKYLPSIPSVEVLGNLKIELAQKANKIIVFPAKYIKSWQLGSCKNLLVSRDFWIHVVKTLLQEGFTPVLYQNYFTYDLSMDFTNQCLYITQDDMAQVLSAFHEIGTVLDIYSGISRLAIAARSSFIALDERQRFINQKDDEINNIFLVSNEQYVFSMAGVATSGDPASWDSSFMKTLMSKIKACYKIGQTSQFSPLTEVDEEVSPEIIKKHVAKRFGVRFVRSKR